MKNDELPNAGVALLGGQSSLPSVHSMEERKISRLGLFNSVGLELIFYARRALARHCRLKQQFFAQFVKLMSGILAPNNGNLKPLWLGRRRRRRGQSG